MLFMTAITIIDLLTAQLANITFNYLQGIFTSMADFTADINYNVTIFAPLRIKQFDYKIFLFHFSLNK